MEQILTEARAAELLERMDGARVALLGDLCLDVYWRADMRLSALSRETPHYPLPVVSERFSPGGAGNVACNIAALKPAKFTAIGVTGNDWRGDLLLKGLAEHGVDTKYVLRSDEVVTNTYIKPIRTGISHVAYEDPRIDFENRGPIPPVLEKVLLERLEHMAGEVDALLVSDQMAFGCVTEGIEVVDAICATTPVTDHNGTVQKANQPKIVSIRVSEVTE